MKKVVIVTTPWASRGYHRFISEICRILNGIVDELTIISWIPEEDKGESVKVVNIPHRLEYAKRESGFFGLISWAHLLIMSQWDQLKALRREVDEGETVIFYLSYPYELLPMIVARLRGGRVVEAITRNRSAVLLQVLFRVQDPIIYRLAHRISPETESLAVDIYGPRSNSKTIASCARFVSHIMSARISSAS
jgi:hypothetical protein